eukprot:CAMPEP_0170621226 /NCGR_PEP_ID=MMETSP0224-20130122/28491_1 /TAXON_ID=285029 /ORGANISM="Togula jolla, Strain CCCM 725" /LENGTH=366 /DNA_ID=CAMNT_0010947477 /DNA_START=65 /DNA_END=1165 /DNA_ORIENTATION=+
MVTVILYALLPVLTLQYGRPVSAANMLRTARPAQKAEANSFLQGEDSQSSTNASYLGSKKDYSACQAEQDPSVRTFLRIVVQAGHGSTALESVLMSSPKVATLCKSNFWQCEGHKLLESMGHGLATDEIDTDFMLTTYSNFWDLSRPVLLDKKTKNMDHLAQQDDILIKNQPPAMMRDHGIQRIETAYVIMYKPLCLWPMSTDLSELVRTNASSYVRSELKKIMQLVDVHKYFTSLGKPPMVVNYADMVWNPDYIQRELRKYLPCVGEVDTDYTPVLGKDVFPGNNMKISTGVKTYGLSSNPWDCCRYKIGIPGKNRPGQCMNQWGLKHEKEGLSGPIEKLLTKEENQQLMDASRYLERLSLARRA